jgi:hypothetical protein
MTQRHAAAVPFLTDDPAQAYQHFLPLLSGRPDDQLEILNVSPDLARTNIRSALDHLDADLETYAAKVQVDPLHLRELPALALGLTFAANPVVVHASSGEIHAREVAMYPRREVALQQLEVLSDPLVHLVDADAVRQLRAAHGRLKLAHSAIGVAALYSTQARQLAGRHPFTDDFLTTLSADGSWLVSQLEPTQAPADHAAPSPAATVRDRFFTELSARYDDLYTVGVKRWGRRQVDRFVPPLHTHAPPPARSTASTAPATVPAATAGPGSPGTPA